MRRKFSASCIIFEDNKNVYGNNLSSIATLCHIVLVQSIMATCKLEVAVSHDHRPDS